MFFPPPSLLQIHPRSPNLFPKPMGINPPITQPPVAGPGQPPPRTSAGLPAQRPERDAEGKVVLGTKAKSKGQPVPDATLRDTENVPLSEDVETYFKREVLPHAADAWIDHEKTKIGYEIPFNHHFYVFQPPRPLAEIDAELKGVTDRILTMIGGLTK